MSEQTTVYGVTTTHPVVALWLILCLLVGIGAVFWTVLSLMWSLVVEVRRAHCRGMARLHRYTRPDVGSVARVGASDRAEGEQ